MGIGATLVLSLLAVLERPSTWVLTLVGFLVRGGWLVVLAPVVVLPTAVGVANVIAPILEDVAFGRRTDQVLLLAGLASLVGLAWLIGGGLLAAAAEVEAVRRIRAETDEEGTGTSSAPAPGPVRRGAAWRVLVVRIVALIPFVVALGWAAVRLVSVGYRELTVPSDVSTPAAWRIVGGAPDALVGLGITWILAEVIGASASRRVILEGDGVGGALRTAVGRLRYRPVPLVVLAVTSLLSLLAVLAVTGLATGVAWSALRTALAAGDASFGTTALLVGFVALFGASLVLIGLTTAWRAATWTVEATSRGVPRTNGTFGGVGGTRSGD